MKNTSFVIIQHEAPRFIEVIYPPEPTDADVADYTMRLKRVIDAQKGQWSCLVDQRAVKTVAPKLLEKILLLNQYGQKKGMARSARVMPSRVSMLQGRRILKGKVRMFSTREEALAWLHSDDSSVDVHET